MSYKYSKGAQVIGDLKAADDTERNTLIDFGEDYIGFETSGSLRMKISGSDGSITFNEAFTFPISDGAANQVLKTNGNGQVTWADQSGGGGGSGAVSSVSNGADDRIATFSSSNALNGESNLNFDGTVLSQNGAPGNAGAYTRLVVKKTGISDNVETAIINFTIPNDLHAAGVFVKGIVTNNNCTRSGAFTHSFSIVRTINNTATAGFPSNTGVLATEATSGGGSPDFTIAGDHNASGGATESNTISYTLTVNTNPSQTSNCVLVVEMLNYNSSGITISIA